MTSIENRITCTAKLLPQMARAKTAVRGRHCDSLLDNLRPDPCEVYYLLVKFSRNSLITYYVRKSLLVKTVSNFVHYKLK